MLYTHTWQSPLGIPLHIAVDKVGALHHVSYHDFRKELAPQQWEENKWACGPVELQLEEYFNGERQSFTCTLALPGTPFQKEVWKKLQRVPFGETISYGELARRVGRRSGARAVGNAVGKNPVAIVVPCHRVVRTNGSMGFYARQTLPEDVGRHIKRQILGIEGISHR